jgi:alkaline phosphatase
VTRRSAARSIAGSLALLVAFASAGDAAAADPVLVGAGDIASCAYTTDSDTAALVDAIPGRVFTAGDLSYPRGTRAQFRDCYGPTWGRFRARTSPAVGNHEYGTPGARGYFRYFGARAGTRGKGWYAYNLGTWRIYVLNSNCDIVRCGAGSQQRRWLKADLAAHPRRCVAAIWHHPLFSSGFHRANPMVRPLWRALAKAGADVVINGHDHDYERFAPQTTAGRPAPAKIREFVVGTGGTSLRPFGAIARNSVARNADTHGVLKLTLHAGSYDWQFVPVAGETWTDAGSASCH